MSELFCIYKNNKFCAEMCHGKIELISRNKKEGFEEYIDILGRVHENLFIKQLDLHDVDVVFRENIELKYKEVYFQLFSSTIKLENIQDNRFMLFTDSEKLAKEYSFEKKEQFVFSKDITKEQIESIKIIQQPIKEFESHGIKEIIIEKEKVNDWLSRISS